MSSPQQEFHRLPTATDLTCEPTFSEDELSEHEPSEPSESELWWERIRLALFLISRTYLDAAGTHQKRQYTTDGGYTFSDDVRADSIQGRTPTGALIWSIQMSADRRKALLNYSIKHIAWALHEFRFNPWGYKIIAKVVRKELGPVIWQRILDVSCI